MNEAAFRLLRLLSDTGNHTQANLLRQLGVAPATLATAVQDARTLGADVTEDQQHGYRLGTPIDWLAYDDVLRALYPCESLLNVEIADLVTSTNTVLMERIGHGARKGDCLCAEMQTHGRGRRGRSWTGSLGGSLTFSLLWRFEQDAAFLSGLSLAIGVALVRGLHELGACDIMLKWPNDVLHHFRKLAGILIELQGDVLGPTMAIIGVGLNAKLDERARADIDQAVTDIGELLTPAPRRSQVLGTLLRHCTEVLQCYERDGFPALRAEWLAHHAYHERAVFLALPDGRRQAGRATSIAPDGSLILDTGAGERRYTVGEITLRGSA